MRATFLAASVLVTFGGPGTSVDAAPTPTPIPGGANQLKGVSGNFSQVLFNGQLRIRGMSLKNPTAADRAMPAFGLGNLVFRVMVSNGEHKRNFGYFQATISDANGVSIAGSVLDDGWDLEPGAAARALYVFKIPSDFVPVKLVLVQAARTSNAFRITIRPSDVPAIPAATP